MSKSDFSPSMTYTPAYYERQMISKSASPTQHQAQYQSLRPPPAAYVSHTRQSPTELHLASPSHVKTSVSSATSGSSAASDYKPPIPSQPYQYSSQAERALMEPSISKHSHPGVSKSPPPIHSPVSYSSQHGGRRPEMIEADPTVIRYIAEQDLEEDEPPEHDHAIWILFWLSFLDPIHCIFSCIFTLVTLLGLVVLSPLRMCQSQISFSTSLIRTICPIYRNHLQLLYAPSVKNAHNFEFSPTRLVLVHTVAPLLSVVLAFWSWIAAVFWLFTITMGNPDGTERRDDGRATIIMTRNRYERFLCTALRKR